MDPYNCNGIIKTLTAMQEELSCPVTLDPMSEAVTLVPCAHKIQQSIAEQLFGITKDGWRVDLPNKGCPICIRPVEGWIKDHLTQACVEKLYSFSPEDIKKTIDSLKEKNPSYPGKPTKFKHEYPGNWEKPFVSGGLYTSDGLLCRMLAFERSNKDSLIQEFRFLGYRDGSIGISITYGGEKGAMVKYLKEYNICCKDIHPISGWNSYCTSTLMDVRKLFAILAENNEIPEPYFTMMQEILKKGCCDPWNC